MLADDDAAPAKVTRVLVCTGKIVGPGGPDTGFTLTLKAAVRAADGGQMQQCKTGNATPGAEPLGDCVLTFVIPG